MISYREKEMLMAMKFIADHTSDFADEIAIAQKEIQEGKLKKHTRESLPSVKSYSDIIDIAKESGYDLDIKIEDLLTSNELEDLETHYDEIEKEFAKKTKLNKTDITFLIGAIVLQLLRQAFQPELEFDAFNDSKNRKGNKETAKDAKEKINEKKKDELRNNAEVDKTQNSRYYHASLSQISNFNYTPYDLTESGKYKLLGLGGSNHRYKTLGHDPWLGYFFGTFNILTDTVTMGKTDGFKSYHVGRSSVGHIIPIANADMGKIIEYGIHRWEESKASVSLAVAHQTYHINSDKLSHDGIPLPLLELFCDTKFIKELTNEGFDYARLELFGNVIKQSMLAEMINYIITVAHKLTIVCQERMIDAKKSGMSLENFEKAMLKKKTLDEVRTRKVILCSLAMSSIANGIIIGGTEAFSIYTHNEKLGKKAIKKLDIGGYISTLIHLFTDVRFISKIKRMYCAERIEENFQTELKKLGVE